MQIVIVAYFIGVWLCLWPLCVHIFANILAHGIRIGPEEISHADNKRTRHFSRFIRILLAYNEHILSFVNKFEIYENIYCK